MKQTNIQILGYSYNDNKEVKTYVFSCGVNGTKMMIGRWGMTCVTAMPR